MIDASTTNTTTTIKYDSHKNVKFRQENISNLDSTIDTKQLITSLTEAFSVFSQQQNDMKSLLMFICFKLSMLFIIVSIVLFVNRDKILNISRYRGFSTKSDTQSTTCINNNFEVSTFSHESSNA